MSTKQPHHPHQPAHASHPGSHSSHTSHSDRSDHSGHTTHRAHHAAHTTRHPHTTPAHHASEHEPVLKPPAPEQPLEANVAAVNLIRQKLDAIYADEQPAPIAPQPAQPALQPLIRPTEPAAAAEIAEVNSVQPPRSKHQQFMYDLHNSGKPMAVIQTAWHQYYLSLDDNEKREVWQEFYANAQQPEPAPAPRPAPDPASIYPTPTSFPEPEILPEPEATTTSASPSEMAPVYQADDSNKTADTAATAAIRDKIRSRIGTRSQLKVKHHVQSLLFGLGFGGLVVLIVLFSFFNEVIIAPFIQPSRSVSATPIIMDADGVANTGKNEVLIPKINLEIPLDFSAKTIDEKDIEDGLDNGVVHYPTTALPGQQGNAAFFGHSSNNIFNPGKYKFAFVLLHELEAGDTFYLNYNGVTYAYQVYDKKIVDPTDVSVLNNVPGKTATATLITCDPPGTSLRRLVVWGEQVSPNPNTNAAATPPAAATPSTTEQSLPGNGPTLWRRMLDALSR